MYIHTYSIFEFMHAYIYACTFIYENGHVASRKHVNMHTFIHLPHNGVHAHMHVHIPQTRTYVYISGCWARASIIRVHKGSLAYMRHIHAHMHA